MSILRLNRQRSRILYALDLDHSIPKAAVRGRKALKDAKVRASPIGF